jgi:hypothetical protein
VGFSGSGLLEAGEAWSCEFPGKGAYSGYHPYHCGSYVAVALMQFLFGIPCFWSSRFLERKFESIIGEQQTSGRWLGM